MNDMLEFLTAHAGGYEPSANTTEQLNKITMAPLVGPVAVGKSTCMDAVVNLDPAFGRVQSFTTRPKRPTEADSEYRFLPHDNISTCTVAEAVHAGELVQCTLHPTTGYIYGSDISDYNKPYMMLDTLSSAVPALRRLPFGGLVEIAVVAEPDEWQGRFNARMQNQTEARKRIAEGCASLEWSLEQGNTTSWICNTEGKLPVVAEEIRNIVTGKVEPNPANREVGERLLRALRANE